MTPVLTIALSMAVVVGSWVGVAVVRRYAKRRLIDLPNERSSHAQPTPRGGGLALTVAHLLGVGAAALLGDMSPQIAVALFGGGILVALIGFLDDHGHVAPSLRLLCHFLSFAWVVWWLGGLPPVDFGWGKVNLGWVGTLLLVLYSVWFLNLFNFMDGIDGIAGVQALFMSLTATLLLVLADGPTGSALPLFLLACATVGFLAWNWPPARIFLGDVGSGYLGFALGAAALWTVVEGWLSPWVWLILGGAFLADATVTLLVRARSRAILTEAHRSHAYQRLSRHWGGHQPVTLVFAAINVFWLGPWAVIATLWPQRAAFCAIVALAPLFAAVSQLGAGRDGEILAMGRRRLDVD